MEKIRIVLVKREKVGGQGEFDQLNKLLKRVFRSFDYMNGFLDALLFDNYILYNVEEFEHTHNNLMNTQNYYIFILKIIENQEDNN